MTRTPYTPKPGDRRYQSQRVGANRFSKVPVDIIRVDDDDMVVVTVNGGRPKRWTLAAVQQLKG